MQLQEQRNGRQIKVCPIGRDVSRMASNLHRVVASKSNKVTERSLEPMWLSTCHPTGTSTVAPRRISCRPTGASLAAQLAHLLSPPRAHLLSLHGRILRPRTCLSVMQSPPVPQTNAKTSHAIIFWFRQKQSHNCFGSTNKRNRFRFR